MRKYFLTLTTPSLQASEAWDEEKGLITKKKNSRNDVEKISFFNIQSRN